MFTAVGNTLRLAVVATFIGFVLGCLFGFVAGYFRETRGSTRAPRCLRARRERAALLAGHGDGDRVLVAADVAAGHGRRARRLGDWAWDWEHLQYLVLPAVTMSVIPMGIIARTVRALVADILTQEFIVGLRAKGLHATSACSATW